MDKEIFSNKLPKKYMAAGALFFNEGGDLLILHPTYKDRWEICGGIVETNESPKKACEREVLEEIGLRRSVGRLLCIDYSINSEGVENLQFIFDGGTLSKKDITQIKCADGEIKSFEFTQTDSKEFKAMILKRDRLGPRLKKAIEARTQGCTFYLEKGETI